MKIIKLFLILLLLGAIIQTSSLVNARHAPALLQADDTDDDDDDDDDETDTLDDDDDEDSEDEKAEKEDAYERKIQIEQEDYQFQVESELEFGDNQDQIEIEFEVGDEAEIQLQYKSEIDALEAKFKYRVAFEKVVEYLDVDGTGFNESSVILSELKLEQWDILNYELLTVNGADLYVVTATTSDQVFSLVLRFAASLLDLDGAILTPNSVKIDILINNYEYVGDTSSLAVSAKIKTESELKKEDVSIEEEAGFTTGESQIAIGALSEGFFSWAETATADGVVINVLASTLTDSSDEDTDLEPNETSQKMYFSFIATNAAEIVWDPKIGVVSEGTQKLISAIESKYGAAAGNGNALPGFGIWILLVSLGAMQVIRLKRKNELSR